MHSSPEGGILGCNWDKNLRTFAPCYSQTHLQQQLKMGGGLALFTILYFSLKETLFFLVLHIFPIETTIRNTSTGGKAARKPNHPCVFRNLYTKQSITENKPKLFMNSIL
jgi:hypothetical protein